MNNQAIFMINKVSRELAKSTIAQFFCTVLYDDLLLTILQENIQCVWLCSFLLQLRLGRLRCPYSHQSIGHGESHGLCPLRRQGGSPLSCRAGQDRGPGGLLSGLLTQAHWGPGHRLCATEKVLLSPKSLIHDADVSRQAVLLSQSLHDYSMGQSFS